MDFKDLLSKYKAGAVTPEEAELVRQEIEKYEILNDYLAEEIEKSIIEKKNKPEASGGDMNIASARKIKKIINRKFILTAVVSIAVVLIGLVLTFYVVSPLMDSSGYQPLKDMIDIPFSGNKLSNDIAVLTELTSPGLVTQWASAEHLGFGNYNVKVSQWDVFKNSVNIYTGKIENRKLKYMIENFYRPAFTSPYRQLWNTDIDNNQSLDDNKDIQEMKNLPESAVVDVSAFFSNDITLEELCDLILKSKNLHFSWITIRTNDRNGQIIVPPIFGFKPSASFEASIEKTKENENLYPNITLAWDYPNETTPEILKNHFTSLVKYMRDNNDFLTLTKDARNPYSNIKTYTDVLAFIEKNGVRAVGCQISGHVQDILALKENPTVDSIMLNNVKASSYSN